ncbi:hypothetical protein [Desulfosporosinus sp. SB140]|uniref:hypothetical protein n=1 Tax=Desulfosporosinus paludis TaxID=3115649 RepID=UPI003890DA7A
MSSIVLILFIAVILIVLMIAGKISTKLFTFMTWRKNAVLAGAYLVVIVLFVPLVSMLPNNGFLQSEINNGAANQSPGLETNLYRIRNKEVFNQQQGMYKNSSQTFKLDQATLKLDMAVNSGYTLIFVERKAENDGKLDVLTYVTPYSIGKTDISKLLIPPRVSLQGGLLSIYPVQQDLTFKLFKTSFIQNQFRPSDMNYSSWTSTKFGINAVYLKVPKSVSLDAGTNQVIMLDN